jgi:4-hydroxy-tetrahydrodipicolinate synthase
MQILNNADNAAAAPRGSIVHLTTPMDGEGRFDPERLEALIDWHIDAGTDGLVVPGAFHETLNLSASDRIGIMQTAVRAAAGRIPVMAFCRGGNLSYVRKACAACGDAGVDGIFVTTPYRGADESAVIHYFTTVADESPIPVFINNAPDETGLSLSYDAARLLCAHDGVAGMLEAGRDVALTARFGRLVGAGFALYAGNDATILPILSLGGVGAVSTLANVFPEQSHNMIMAYLNGYEEIARRIQRRCADLVSALHTGGGPALKAAMAHVGRDAGNFVCQSSGELDEESRRTLLRLIDEFVNDFESVRKRARTAPVFLSATSA